MSERIYQVIIGVLVLVVIVGGWMMIAGKRGGSSSQSGSNSTSTATTSSGTSGTSGASGSQSGSRSEPSVASSGEAVEADDQSAGKSVVAESVMLKSRGWVAVEDEREWILGAKRLEAGTHENVEVALLRATEAGETYKVVLFVDDGDGAFDLHKDTVITNSDGSALSSAFIAK